MGQGCVFFTVAGKLFGIYLEDLMKMGKDGILDWDSSWQPPAPPFYMVDVPNPKWKIVHPFVLDSKIYVAGGGYAASYGECNILEFAPPCEIYQFDIDRKGFTLAHSVPQPPTRFAPAFLGNISDLDYVFMLAYQGEYISSNENLWYLSPGRNWEPLGLHDDLWTENFYFVCEYFGSTKLQDKILICPRAEDDKDYLYSFDVKTKHWKLMDIHLCGSWVHKLHGGCVMTSFPYPCWSNYRVILSWETKHSEDPDSFSGTMFIQAFMVNEENLATIYCQPLWECFEGIQHPSLFELRTVSVGFVDLGNNTICALVHGITYEDYDNALICVSIFKISPFSIGLAETPLVIGLDHSLQKERKFLSVDVIVKRVFYMKESDHSAWYYPPILSSFVFHSKMDLQTCFPFKGEEVN